MAATSGLHRFQALARAGTGKTVRTRLNPRGGRRAIRDAGSGLDVGGLGGTGDRSAVSGTEVTVESERHGAKQSIPPEPATRPSPAEWRLSETLEKAGSSQAARRPYGVRKVTNEFRTPAWRPNHSDDDGGC